MGESREGNEQHVPGTGAVVRPAPLPALDLAKGIAQPWIIWQIIDSGFPASGFVHSMGLECGVQMGLIDPRERRGTGRKGTAGTNPLTSVSGVGLSIGRYILASLQQTAATSLPILSAAYASVMDLQAEKTTGSRSRSLAYVDDFCDATLTNHVANRASTAQGKALLSSCATVFGSPLIAQLKTSIGVTRDAWETGADDLSLPYGHYAPVFGVVCQQLGIDCMEAQRMFMFTTLRGLISSAVRMNVMGPYEGQQVQAQCIAFAEELLLRYVSNTLDDVAQTTPILELVQGCHDRLYSRLFCS